MKVQQGQIKIAQWSTWSSLTKNSEILKVCSQAFNSMPVEEQGYHYLNTRQKGIITKSDKWLRRAFAKKCSNVEGLCKKRISFYHDAATFYHKRDPYSELLHLI